ncbi:uncharacterized protein [Palaemon carinicauda]|uniref:uncharacterized protein n=1 Tax=Palaemon carinicauda TaxID=392227 RepID=UPI0035B65481
MTTEDVDELLDCHSQLLTEADLEDLTKSANAFLVFQSPWSNLQQIFHHHNGRRFVTRLFRVMNGSLFFSHENFKSGWMGNVDEFVQSNAVAYSLRQTNNIITRWPKVIPIEPAISASCTSASLSGWIVKFGIPEPIPSDRGTSFNSQFWTSLVNPLEITLYQKTAENPTVNGKVEHFYRTFKTALMLCYNFNWFTQLPWVLR